MLRDIILKNKNIEKNNVNTSSNKKKDNHKIFKLIKYIFLILLLIFIIYLVINYIQWKKLATQMMQNTSSQVYDYER
jgi:magnesium-transporting ATPase (P-type)